ncbi:MAG: SO_0444 family Cu/Zn efflux transporter [Candidatus Zixiibacteriota bacterium]
MAAFLNTWAEATWQVLVDSASYFILGLVLAGLVWLFLNEKNLNRLLGRSRHQAVIRAALIGVPLPLCSCSVLPVAAQLRNAGLSRGGTVSFLIATPESSVDSILLTYSLTDPLMTVARPVAAFLTATVGGLVEDFFDREPLRQTFGVAVPHTDDCAHECNCEPPRQASGHLSRVGSGIRYSFTTLIGDLAPYLFWGYLLAGLAAAAFGSPLGLTPGTGWWPYLAAIVVGVPLYVCATSSTPLAAVLLGAGFPPGAIMVFLMVGPATNLATMTVVRKLLGAWPTVRYVLSIVVVSLACGLTLDWLYRQFNIDIAYRAAGHEHGVHWIHSVAALCLAGLVLWHYGRQVIRRFTR